jgi:hypothetical protein
MIAENLERAEPTSIADRASRPPPDAVDAALHDIARHVRLLLQTDATGPLAELRRMDPTHPDTMAFAAVSVMPAVAAFARVEGDAGEMDILRRLAAAAQIMALKPGDLQPWGLGKAMVDAGLTENRLRSLLAARGPALRDIARTLSRRLARAPGPLPYRELGRLILLDSRDPHAAEEARIELARDFRRALYKAKKHDGPDAA